MTTTSAASGDGSDFTTDGDYLQDTSNAAKRLKLSNIEGGETAISSPTQILSLHTDWVQREEETGDRVSAYVGSETEGAISVPQSDFEIEINSSGQDGNNSPAGQEISLSSSNSITIPIEPRILTIDARLTSDSSTLHPASPNATITTTVVTDMSSEPIQPSLSVDGNPVSIIPTSMGTQPTDYSSLMRPNMIQVADQQSLMAHNDLPGSQFIQTTGDGATPGGPLYVMIPPTSNSAEFLQAMQHVQRPVIPRLSSGAIVSPVVSDDNKTHKDMIRKQTHNEVERRRRDRINELIKILAEVVPGCQKKDSSNGNIVGYVYSKGTVLEKTVEYVRELIIQNDQLASTAKMAEKSASAIQLLQNQIAVLEKENTFLRAQMVQLGIDNTSSPLGGARSLLANPLAQSLLSSQIVTPPPPPPPAAAVPNNTSQLLVSLAQTLTSNPLLASLSQSSPPSLPTPNSNTTVSPVVTNDTQVNSQPQVIPSSQANVLMNSLVQTLASIANTNNTALSPAPPPPPPPPTQTTGLSASAAMSLLNSLIMAQSSTTTNTSQSVPLSSNPSPNLLVPPSLNSQEKPIPSPPAQPPSM